MVGLIGHIYNVVGDVTSRDGMTYECRAESYFAHTETYHTHQKLGHVAASCYPKLQALFQSCQRPPKQKSYNVARNATEPFKTIDPLTFYTEDELKNFQFPRLKKCKWWVEESALPALQQSQLIVEHPSP
ncbi:hypothetical protein GQ44DRAFT_731548 [Phaeosphaeriaceae sp. PMI808]|nr:hypothetical protein GQ44DRAFT_731548 [Phaeosphaeriaceae sp. PMI808]